MLHRYYILYWGCGLSSPGAELFCMYRPILVRPRGCIMITSTNKAAVTNLLLNLQATWAVLAVIARRCRRRCRRDLSRPTELFPTLGSTCGPVFDLVTHSGWVSFWKYWIMFFRFAVFGHSGAFLLAKLALTICYVATATFEYRRGIAVFMVRRLCVRSWIWLPAEHFMIKTPPPPEMAPRNWFSCTNWNTWTPWTYKNPLKIFGPPTVDPSTFGRGMTIKLVYKIIRISILHIIMVIANTSVL